jgi:hypothetical protein
MSAQSPGFDTFSDPVSLIPELKAKGISWIALYYFHTSGFKKLLTHDIALALSKAGFYVVAVYENGEPTTIEYFTPTRGSFDLATIQLRVQQCEQPSGSCIYATVDFEVEESDLDKIGAYFKELQPIRKTHLLGAYAEGLVLEYLLKENLIDKAWLSQSKGFYDYQKFIDSGKANIIQGIETTQLGEDIDKDISNGNAGGFKVLT